MSPTIESASNQILGALLTGGAYGMLLLLAVWLALKAARRSNASTRHAAWFVTLLIVALLPAALLLAPGLARAYQPLTATSITAEPPPHHPPSTILPATVSEVGTETSVEPTPVETDSLSGPALDSTPAVAAVDPRRWQVPAPGRFSVILVGTLLVLALIRLAGLLLQVRELARLKREATAPDIAVDQIFQACVTGLRSSRKSHLLVSPAIPAPMVIGYLRPAVLVPSSVIQATTPTQLGHILRHELAHLARRDDWANLVQQGIGSVLFFHPAIWFISRRLAAEREIACDDHALAGAPSPRDYALLLTEFAGRMKGRGFTAAPAAWNKHSQLKERIDMILDRKRNATPRVSPIGVGAITLVTVGLALAALITLPRVTLAGEPTDTSTETQAAPAPSGDDAITLETRVDVDVEVATEEVPRVEIRRVETRTGGPSVIIETTAPIEKHAPPTPEDIGGHPTPVPAPATAPSVTLRPTPPLPAHPPIPAGNPPPVIIASGHAGSSRFIVDHDGSDLERRLERVERMLESLVGREKAGSSSSKKTETTKSITPELQKKIQADVAHAHREMEKALRDIDIKAIEKRALDSSLHAKNEASRAMAGAIDSMKARQKELEARRRELERESAALDREIEQMRRDRERMSEQREKDREENRLAKEKDRPSERERSEETRAQELKRRDTGEGQTTDPTIKR